MAIHTLYRAQAFGPGCALWIIADQPKNPINIRIDWYLNFQLMKARSHHTEKWAPQLKTILKDNNITQFENEDSIKKPLMVPADQNFPVNNIVEIPSPEDKKNWVSKAQTIWEKLNHPELRVFLPTEISTEEFKTYWSGPKNKDITVVPS
jgi:hypothetical protein